MEDGNKNAQNTKYIRGVEIYKNVQKRNIFIFHLSF